MARHHHHQAEDARVLDLMAQEWARESALVQVASAAAAVVAVEAVGAWVQLQIWCVEVICLARWVRTAL